MKICHQAKEIETIICIRIIFASTTSNTKLYLYHVNYIKPYFNERKKIISTRIKIYLLKCYNYKIYIVSCRIYMNHFHVN